MRQRDSIDRLADPGDGLATTDQWLAAVRAELRHLGRRRAALRREAAAALEKRRRLEREGARRARR